MTLICDHCRRKYDLLEGHIDTVLTYARCPFCHTPRDEKAYNTIQNRCIDCHQPIEAGMMYCRAHYTQRWRAKKSQKTPVVVE